MEELLVYPVRMRPLEADASSTALGGYMTQLVCRRGTYCLVTAITGGGG
jgi:hypothetical protein